MQMVLGYGLAFLLTNIDFFILLFVLLNRFSLKSVWAGYLLGVLGISLISLLFGELIHDLIPTWLIGGLGLVLIVLALLPDNDEPDVKRLKTQNGLLVVFIAYLISCAADNLSVFVSIFAMHSLNENILGIATFLGIGCLSIVIVHFLSGRPQVKQFLSKWENPLTRITYLFIGISVVIESGFLTHILQLLTH